MAKQWCSVSAILFLGLLVCLSLHLWTANLLFLEPQETLIPLSRAVEAQRLQKQKAPFLSRGTLVCPTIGTNAVHDTDTDTSNSDREENDASEMIYWRDDATTTKTTTRMIIEQQRQRNEPIHSTYLLMDADPAGWNNKRISFEVHCLLARAMGRTLVLPPNGEWFGFSLFRHNFSGLGFDNVYDIQNLRQHGLQIITMNEFLQRETFKYPNNTATRPPNNRTDWNGAWLSDLRTWLQQVTHTLTWRHEDCIVAIPKDPNDTSRIIQAYQRIQQQQQHKGYVPVDAPLEDRMREILLGRTLCLNNSTIQHQKYIYYHITQKGPFSMEFQYRLLVWFYQFIFFEDNAMDLSAKRFIRDSLRYKDELQCAAAKIVKSLRQKSPNGIFHTFHCRRSEQFSYQFGLQPTAEEIVNTALMDIPKGSTVYVATDDMNQTWFQPFLGNWNVFFLSHFEEQIQGISSEYYGMIDQLVASRGTIFFGSWSSTFTGFINRMRGYHSQIWHMDGWNEGSIESYFYQSEHRNAMKSYESPTTFWFAREFPIAWRDIDHNTYVEDFK